VVLWVTKVCSLKRPAIVITPAIEKEAAVFTETSVNNIKSASKFNFLLKV